MEPDPGAELEPARDAVARDRAEQRAFDIVARDDPQRCVRAEQQRRADAALEAEMTDRDERAGAVDDRDAARDRALDPQIVTGARHVLDHHHFFGIGTRERRRHRRCRLRAGFAIGLVVHVLAMVRRRATFISVAIVADTIGVCIVLHALTLQRFLGRRLVVVVGRFV